MQLKFTDFVIATTQIIEETLGKDSLQVLYEHNYSANKYNVRVLTKDGKYFGYWYYPYKDFYHQGFFEKFITLFKEHFKKELILKIKGDEE